MEISSPSLDQLRRCFEIEANYSVDSLSASNDGFFLPGTTFANYEDLFNSGYVRVIQNTDKEIVSYILVVPPGHHIIHRLVTNNESLLVFNSQVSLDPEEVVWIAKIATNRKYRRNGFASKLYQQIFEDFHGMTILTATALSPMRNLPSEAFHMKSGMNAIGVFLSGKKGNLDNIVNIVWGRSHSNLQTHY